MLRKLEWDELTIGFIFISIMFQGKFKIEKTKHFGGFKTGERVLRYARYLVFICNEYFAQKCIMPFKDILNRHYYTQYSSLLDNHTMFTKLKYYLLK